MAPLIIEGNTLGEKHRSYNKIVNDAIKNKVYEEVADINYEESDLENLLKIDIACHNRNVEYVLKVFKCEDILYVSRAIKQSTWLITDQKYAHIVNPTYLFNELFPQMTSKAINKFILHIRLNLKDEKRVEDFFNHYKEENLYTAFKWLPHCSITFIENIIKEHTSRIPHKLIGRLCLKSTLCLDAYYKYNDHKLDFFSSKKFFFRNNANKYLDIIDDNISLKTYIGEVAKPKLTELIMSQCSDRVIKNFELYTDCLDVPTIIKSIKKEESKNFFFKHKKNKALQPFFQISEVQALMNRLPLENRMELIKKIFKDTKNKNKSNKESSNRIMFSWYAYAPFCTAFEEFKRVIQEDTNPTDRLKMFKALLSSAKHKLQDTYTVLKYYRENHINEPYNYKIQFVNHLLSTTNTHLFDKVAWGYLDDLFVSLDVYKESGNQDEQTCVKAIILYKVIHNEVVPGIIEKKFIMDTCKEYQRKITEEENKKVFSYLLEHMTSIMEKDIKDQEKFTQTGDVLEQILHLLLDWKRELQDFPHVIQKIKEMIYLKRVKSWDYDITKLYNIKKSWKKLFFSESILLNPNQEVFLNALKHGPEILETYKAEMEIICLSDNVHIVEFLKKIRIYGPVSLANYYKKIFLNNLNQITKQKLAIIGLCALLSRDEFLSLVKKYVPVEEKIGSNQHDDVELSLRKHIATKLHLARPQPSLATVLSYAKGDYVHYVLPSLSAIIYNISGNYATEFANQLIDAPISLQKQGTRLCSRKLNKKQLIKLYHDIWNKNCNLRSIVFCKTFDMLCEEKDPETIDIIWKSLGMFIDSLTTKEDHRVYRKLVKFRDVPDCVREDFWMKSNKILKANQSNPKVKIVYYLFLNSNYWLATSEDVLSDDIVTEILLGSLDERLSTGNYEYPDTLAQYILSCKSEELQIQRYHKILVPILERCFALWDTKHENHYYVRIFLDKFCKSLCSDYITYFFYKEKFFPTAVLKDIVNKFESNLPMSENFVILLRFKLANSFYNILSQKKELIKELRESACGSYPPWQKLNEAGAQEIGRECVKHLREDVKSVYPTVYNIYAKILNNLCRYCNFDLTNVCLVLKTILEAKDLIEGHLLVLQIMKEKRSNYDDLNEFKILEKELLEEINTHPSDEVKYHYWQYWYYNIGINYRF